jgi:hypothetical protein
MFTPQTGFREVKRLLQDFSRVSESWVGLSSKLPNFILSETLTISFHACAIWDPGKFGYRTHLWR